MNDQRLSERALWVHMQLSNSVRIKTIKTELSRTHERIGRAEHPQARELL